MTMSPRVAGAALGRPACGGDGFGHQYGNMTTGDQNRAGNQLS
jgi:hypothetical protein